MTLLGESFVLASVGSAGGILLAFWLLDAVRVHLPVGLPRIEEVAVDLPTLLFALFVTLLCAMACGLAPAWRLSGGETRAMQRRCSSSNSIICRSVRSSLRIFGSISLQSSTACK